MRGHPDLLSLLPQPAIYFQGRTITPLPCPLVAVCEAKQKIQSSSLLQFRIAIHKKTLVWDRTLIWRTHHPKWKLLFFPKILLSSSNDSFTTTQSETFASILWKGSLNIFNESFGIFLQQKFCHHLKWKAFLHHKWMFHNHINWMFYHGLIWRLCCYLNESFAVQHNFFSYLGQKFCCHHLIMFCHFLYSKFCYHYLKLKFAIMILNESSSLIWSKS